MHHLLLVIALLTLGVAALHQRAYSADSNPVTNINAGVKDERFFLATGGETENSGTRLKDFATLPEAAHRKAPADLPAAR